MNPKVYLVLMVFFMMSCSGFEKTEQRSIRRVNAQAEKILRFHDEYYYSFDFPEKKEREPYSWEKR